MQSIILETNESLFSKLNDVSISETCHLVKDVSCPWEKEKGISTYAHALVSEASGKNGNVLVAESDKTSTPPRESFVQLDLNNPIELSSVDIEKPWGKEVWFTGIEKRGISKAILGNKEFKLSSLTSFLGESFIESKSKEPILLKILAPNPDQNFGNLYYELHTEKQEVYIVSHVSDKIDKARMKYGISSEKLSQYDSSDLFKVDFKSTVVEYESIRKKIEKIFSGYRKEHGFDENAPLSSDQLKKFYDKLSSEDEGQELILQETNAKERLETFVGWKNLGVGDVVSVETHVPHSLQHGVEVIEFQTPVYERFIISFDQKVLTQKDWNVDEAFGVMKMTPPSDQPLETLETTDSFLRESVVKFSDFNVERVTIKDKLKVKASGKHTLVYILSGAVKTDSTTLEAGKAYFIPAQSVDQVFSNNSDVKTQVLIALPN